MPKDAWKGSWIIDGRPATTQDMEDTSDHSSSYDGGGDSLTDVDDSSDHPSSSEDEDDLCTCLGCGQNDATFVIHTCPRCEEDFCNRCRTECVGCEVPMCTACDPVCVKCNDLYEMRSIHILRRDHDMLEYEIQSPSDFQEFLDRVSVHKGVDLEMEHRGEDGLERWPPLEPLPKVPTDGQYVIDDFVKRVPVLTTLNHRKVVA